MIKLQLECRLGIIYVARLSLFINNEFNIEQREFNHVILLLIIAEIKFA